MGVTQVAAMLQDILPPVPAQGRAGEPGASEGASFGKVLQERQSSPEGAANQGHTGASSPRVIAARPPASRKTSAKHEAEATGDGKQGRNSKAEGASSEDSLQPLEKREEGADEATVENLQEVAESAIATAGNAVVVVAEATAPATDVSEEMPNDRTAGEAATVAVESAGTLLDSGVGAAGTAVIVKDGAAAAAVTGGANAAGTNGETPLDTAAAVTEKPAQHPEKSGGASPKQESKGAATEARSNTGTIASERTHSDVTRFQGVSGDGASGTDEASARLEAAAGLAAVDANATDAAVKQNQDNGAQADVAVPPEQRDAGLQEGGKDGGDVGPATAISREASPAAEVQREQAGVQEKEWAAKGEPKEARLEGGERRHPAAQAVEQGTAGAVRDTEAASVGRTSAVADARVAAPQAKAGEEGAGNPAGKGGDEQQQAKQGEQVLPAPVSGDARAPEAAAGGYRNEEERTALHRSILSQVKDGAVSHDSKGNGEMNIRLNPAELGELRIQVRMEDGRVRVEVQAENRMVKDLLMSNLDTLKEALAGKNFTMEGFQVSTGGGFNNAHPEQRANPQQHHVRRVPGSGYAEADGSKGRVKYLTADVNNLLDVRF